MILHGLRLLFLLVVVALTASYAFREDVTRRGPTYVTLYIVLPAMAAFALILLDMLWRRKRLHVLSGVFFGLLGGVVIAYTLTLVVDLIVQVFPAAADPQVVLLVKALLSAAAVFACVTFVLQTKDDFRFVIPYVEFSRQTKGARPFLLDTSVIIDGRIADIAETRILESDLVVPRFVLAEVQSIADSDDKLRRNRGRRGLEILDRLQRSDKIEFQILDTDLPTTAELTDVDAKLMALAAHINGRIVTNDYNLNKISQLRGVDVININDLANAIKPVVLPGESLAIKMIKPGEDPGQGVGYLDDGTMVVAENGRDHIGREITINVTSVLQTSAGRMIFGRLDPDKTFTIRRQHPPSTDDR